MDEGLSVREHLIDVPLDLDRQIVCGLDGPLSGQRQYDENLALTSRLDRPQGRKLDAQRPDVRSIVLGPRRAIVAGACIG